MTESEYTPREKVALVVWHLAHGDGLSTANVAEMTGLTRQGAWELMVCLSRVIPIYQDNRQIWQVCALRELEYAGVAF